MGISGIFKAFLKQISGVSHTYLQAYLKHILDTSQANLKHNLAYHRLISYLRYISDKSNVYLRHFSDIFQAFLRPNSTLYISNKSNISHSHFRHSLDKFLSKFQLSYMEMIMPQPSIQYFQIISISYYISHILSVYSQPYDIIAKDLYRFFTYWTLFTAMIYHTIYSQY